MNGFNTIGDLSRIAQLRQSNAMLKSRIAVLSQEVSSGVRSDLAAATGGNLGRLAQIESRLEMLDSYGRNASAAAQGFDALQLSLGVIGDMAAERGPALLQASAFPDDTSIAVQAAQLGRDLETVVGMINTEVAGRYPLSGSAVTTRPLSSADDIISLARAQVAGLTDPVAVTARLDAWFASPDASGFMAVAFHGDTQATSVGISPELTVTHDLNAVDPALKQALKGIVTGIIATDGSQPLSGTARIELLTQAGAELSSAAGGVTTLRARLGMNQEMVETASTRNAAEQAALSMARSDVVAVDAYETASALTQTEASLQTLYALTARLSRLSLADYL